MAKLTSKAALIFFAVFSLVILDSLPSKAQEVEDESEFSYDGNSENGPQNWGKIRPDWRDCGEGELQSPIDLTHERVHVIHLLGPLRQSYRPANATLKNRGHDIMVRFEEDAGLLRINGTEYALKQLHWHSPSEHSVNGRRYAMELHLVHESSDGKIAVVGILYTIGRPEPFLEELEGFIKKISETKDAEENVGFINPRHIKKGSRKYYRYLGSLTTPPCTEGVSWTIIKKVRTVSREQVRLLREAVHDESEKNARPIQPLNDRGIKLYRPLIKPKY